MNIIVNEVIKDKLLPVLKYTNERVDLFKSMRNVKVSLRLKKYFITKDGNRLGKRKYHKYLNMYFRSLQLKMDTNSVYGSYGSNSSLLRPMTLHTDDLQSMKREDFKVGDTVINKSRNNAIYTLDITDLYRFKDDELALV